MKPCFNRLMIVYSWKLLKSCHIFDFVIHKRYVEKFEDKWIIYFFNRTLAKWKFWVQTSCFALLEMEGKHTGQNICNYIQVMLSNLNITFDRVQVFFLRDYAKIFKKAISLLKTSSVPCFINTLQLLIKDSLFKDDLIKLILAKIWKLVCHFSHSSKANEIMKRSR